MRRQAGGGTAPVHARSGSRARRGATLHCVLLESCQLTRRCQSAPVLTDSALCPVCRFSFRTVHKPTARCCSTTASQVRAGASAAQRRAPRRDRGCLRERLLERGWRGAGCSGGKRGWLAALDYSMQCSLSRDWEPQRCLRFRGAAQRAGSEGTLPTGCTRWGGVPCTVSTPAPAITSVPHATCIHRQFVSPAPPTCCCT